MSDSNTPEIIWLEESTPNSWTCFRKNVVIEKQHKEVLLKISADTKYWLYINGESAIFEGGLCRESLPGCGYYDEIEISKYLVPGENVLAVLVWYWGNSGRNNVDSGQAGLLVECPQISLYSDSSFKAIRHPCFSDTDHPLPSYLYGGHNIRYTDVRDFGNWFKPDFIDSAWGSAHVFPPEKWGRSVKRPIPLHKVSAEKDYTFVDRQRNCFACHLPYACQVLPILKISCGTDTKIEIRTDRYEVNGGPGDSDNVYRGHRIEYFARPGYSEFESPNWLFGEIVYYFCDNEEAVITFTFKETGYDCEITGYFKSSNEIINTLMEKAARTLYVCMRDNYMDCPDRERGQWIGDVSIQVPQSFYFLDRNADLLTRKAINDFINLRKGKVLCGNVPGIYAGELPGQSLNAISDIGMIMQYYRYSGDESILSLSYHAIVDYLMLWEIDDTGLVIPRGGDWYWFDHLDNQDQPIMENCWYFMALKAAIFIAETLGIEDDIVELQRRAKSISGNFHRFRIRGKYQTADIPDDRANALIVLSGLYKESELEAVIDVLLHSHYSSPYMENYVLEALGSAGYVQEAVDRIISRYSDLARNSNTTLWEDFSILGTKNHAWSGGFAAFLFKYIAGIRIDKSNDPTISVFPEKSSVKRISAKFVTSKGEMSIKVDHDDDVFIVEGGCNNDIEYFLGVPYTSFHSLYLNELPATPLTTITGHSYFRVRGNNVLKCVLNKD